MEIDPPSSVDFGETKGEQIKYNKNKGMKNKGKNFSILGILIFCGLFLGGCGVGRSGLEIVSNPIAKVYINDKEMGRSPYKSNDLKPGIVKVKILNDDGKIWEREIRLEENVSTVVSWNFEGESGSGGYLLAMERAGEGGALLINTQPENANVSVAGENKGYTPLRAENIGEGDKNISIAYPGYKNLNLIVKMVKGYQLIIDAKLVAEKIAEVTPVATIQNSVTPSGPRIRIKETGTGWLRVREGANNSSAEIGRVIPGETYEYMSSDADWYLIKFKDKEGWVSAKYVERISE